MTIKNLKIMENSGDLLSINRGIIVHGCNAQGVMGSGVAKAVRTTYPGAWEAYRKQFEQKGLELGDVVWFVAQPSPNHLAIANAITQKYYGRDENRVYVDYDAIRMVFKKIGDIARKYSLEVHYPKIGAGLAHGDWNKISPIILEELTGVTHTLWVQPTPGKRIKPV